MKTFIYYLSVLVAMLTVASCENELPFNIKDNPPKLVMNALINADSLTNTLFLNFTGKENPTHVQDATVEVRVNGQLTESLRPLPLDEDEAKQCRFTITSKFNADDVVRIDAFTDDGKYHAWAEATVPKRLEKIDNIDTLTVPMKSYGMTSNYLRCKITFRDHPNENNYYRLIVNKRSTLTDYDGSTRIKNNYMIIDREDIVLTDGHPTTSEDEDNGMFDPVKNVYSVFDDSRFKDSPYTMTIYSRPTLDYYLGNPTSVKIDIIISLLSITEAEYYYLKALNLIDSDNYDETINEPIKFPSNVQGGTGIVGFSTEVSQTIHISEFNINFASQNAY